ncbi:DUF4250 domain-containing protein [uncultured Eubacterium sp.]|uniref:DUF4250 domain-containing protein n=1 Tax=uncultured Eubacterium sp. TaxID=165185 RepID=UPI002593067C|nr:DUF4250 domain-containing protein [uncultured Eubacterium sp.]
MILPKDPVMLLSVVNTELRDRYPSLEELAKAYGVTEQEITDQLALIKYEYQPETNQFR